MGKYWYDNMENIFKYDKILQRKNKIEFLLFKDLLSFNKYIFQKLFYQIDQL